ncbi:MAG: hypothetical protein ACW98X_22025 [Promethearchaeota archaeon]|jgi:hypothetical protein
MWTKEEIKIFKNYASIMTGKKSGKIFKCKMSETARRVKELIERYNEDGYGDKPPEMNRVEYWIQHLN